jgi:hypothetical protein
VSDFATTIFVAEVTVGSSLRAGQRSRARGADPGRTVFGVVRFNFVPMWVS